MKTLAHLHFSPALKTISKIATGGALALAGALFFGYTLAHSNSDSILIESEESKTIDNTSVFNRIRWFQTATQDIWMMQQSHEGPHAGEKGWERLAIVVDKTRSPKTARFIQLESGPLVWDPKAKTREFRVSCFMCHTNGPRAIRPISDSASAPLSISDRVRVFAWNMRIKTYGRIVADPAHDSETRAIPFRHGEKILNQSLQVKTCLHCHKEEGALARGLLTRQNGVTIQSMIERGVMPPFPFKLSQAEKEEIRQFVSGF